MAEDKPVERRRHPRAARKFLVKFRIIGGPAPPDVADQLGQVVNVSKGGILLLVKRPLPAKTVLDLKFPENAIGGEARTLQGMVCHIDPETKEGDTPVGLMFVRIAAQSAKGPQLLPAAPGDRRGLRRKAQNLFVQLRCGAAEPRRASVLNLSENGMELLSPQDYAPGAELEVEIPENPLGPARTVRAAVVWTKPAGEGQYRVGTLFAAR